MRVELSEQQKELRKYIQGKLNVIRDYLNLSHKERDESKVDIIELHEKMAKAAHELHMQLDPKPKHHRYMIENRGVVPEDPEFYNHIHPVEDLLSYLDDTSANDDPEDVTLGDKFYMSIYTRRWGHDDRYELQRNEKGWYISHLSYSDQGGRDAEPILGYILRHDSVSYPQNLSSIMEDIWVRAEEEGLLHDEVQKMLNQVAEWVSLTERNYPNNISR